MASSKEDLAKLFDSYAHPQSLSYGTAGFRAKATVLEEAILRCGVLAACRSHTHGGQAVGGMITASHNPPADNGLKLVEPDGSMLDAEWEPVITNFVNQSINPLDTLAPLFDMHGVFPLQSAKVVVGRDTRESSPVLADLFIKGVEATGSKAVNIGQVTTPQLHCAVVDTNAHGSCNLEDYFNKLSKALGRLLGTNGAQPVLTNQIVVDCANGIGASAMSRVRHLLPNCTLVNLPGQGALNDKCGADYVQKNRIMPNVYGTRPHVEEWASLDGDADRLVMYCRSEVADSIVIADGDRFAALVTHFISKALKTSEISGISVAVAQTAYSNGAATDFLKALDGVEVVIAKTGVKHLEKAVRTFDIGIYWEPNGHGTVLFNAVATQTLEAAYQRSCGHKSRCLQMESLNLLLSISQLANQAVGDGVADLLLVMGILKHNSWTFTDWLQMYDERSSCNMIVHVLDKSVIRTTDCDRQVERPSTLRNTIESVSSDEGCRAFVRPSGTEDVVRVYSEAPAGSLGVAREMALAICRSVYDNCAGVGGRP